MQDESDVFVVDVNSYSHQMNFCICSLGKSPNGLHLFFIFVQTNGDISVSAVFAPLIIVKTIAYKIMDDGFRITVTCVLSQVNF